MRMHRCSRLLKRKEVENMAVITKSKPSRRTQQKPYSFTSPKFSSNNKRRSKEFALALQKNKEEIKNEEKYNYNGVRKR